jgi:hypothetical protein
MVSDSQIIESKRTIKSCAIIETMKAEGAGLSSLSTLRSKQVGFGLFRGTGIFKEKKRLRKFETKKLGIGRFKVGLGPMEYGKNSITK